MLSASDGHRNNVALRQRDIRATKAVMHAGDRVKLVCILGDGLCSKSLERFVSLAMY